MKSLFILLSPNFNKTSLLKKSSILLQQLKAELEKAWLMLDAANEKEQRGRETIETLKVEIDNLTKVPFDLNF